MRMNRVKKLWREGKPAVGGWLSIPHCLAAEVMAHNAHQDAVEKFLKPLDRSESIRETVEATLREAARCTREGIRINTFMLDADHGLRRFIEQLTKVNKGKAFFTTPDTLGDYVLVDFLDHKRTMAGRR